MSDCQPTDISETEPKTEEIINNRSNKQEYIIDGELLAQGAEAKLYKQRATNINGVDWMLIKHRFSKKYRHPKLDAMLRKKRTNAEVKGIERARKIGVNVPRVFRHDRQNSALFLEWFDLRTVKQEIYSLYDKNTKLYDSKCELIAKEIGRNVALLHENDCIHGDLTTSNMLIQLSNKNNCLQYSLIMIDFGLSEKSTKAEDKAVDLYVLERALLSTHPQSKWLTNIILNTYEIHFNERNREQCQKVMDRLQAVRLRGRKRCVFG